MRKNVVKYLTYFNGKIMGVMCQAEIFRDESLMVYEHFKTNLKVMGVVVYPQSGCIFVLMILQGKTVKTAHVEELPRTLSWCIQADSF